MDSKPSNQSEPDRPRANPPEADDPRLAIPEILREKQPGPSTPDSGKIKDSFGDTAKAWGMGLDMVFTTIGGFGVGWAIDWWQGTGPWGAVIGLGLGFVLAMIRLVRYSVRADAKEQAERQRRQQPERPDSDRENPPPSPTP